MKSRAGTPRHEYGNEIRRVRFLPWEMLSDQNESGDSASTRLLELEELGFEKRVIDVLRSRRT